MNRWRLIFIAISCLLIWANEWSKINCNYQLYIRNNHPTWEDLSIEDRLAIKAQDEIDLPYSFFHAHVDFDWMYAQSFAFWVQMKWIIPVVFTLLFCITEWWLLPLCFPQLPINRIWVGGYYIGLILLVLFFFFISKTLHSEPIFAVTRKIWMILQSPSLFVLLFVYQFFQNDQNSTKNRSVSK